MKSTTKILSKDSLAAQLEKMEYDIVSISYLNEDSTRRSPRSIMNNFKVLVMLSGQAEVFMGRNRYYCKKSDCVIFAPGSLYHAEISGPERCQFISINFSLTQPVMDSYFKDMLALKDIAIFRQIVPEETIEYMWSVFSDVQAGTDGSYYDVALLLKHLVSLMVYSKPVLSQTKLKNISLSGERLVMKCHRYIMNNPEQSVTVTDLCRLCNVSQSYMYKSFRQITGMSTKDFITHIKLETAAKALLQTDKTVVHIAHENGYANGYRFSASFKKHYGLSPSAYRRENK